MSELNTRVNAFLGQSVILGMITGIAALIAAILTFILRDWVATGVCLGAAGLSFGLLANAMMRE